MPPVPVMEPAVSVKKKSIVLPSCMCSVNCSRRGTAKRHGCSTNAFHPWNGSGANVDFLLPNFQPVGNSYLLSIGGRHAAFSGECLDSSHGISPVLLVFRSDEVACRV